MNPLLWAHIAGGFVALLAGTAAAVAQKGGTMHARAGTWFAVSMLVLGATAAILSPFRTPPESPAAGILVCYFVATAWMAARGRSGVPGRFEEVACGTILLIAAAIAFHAYEVAQAPKGTFGPPGPVGLSVLCGICLLAGVGDLRFILRGRLSATQRYSRHLWRMCFAFFIATGSFFLGQMDVLPQSLRHLPTLLVLGFAPFVLMLYWLVRIRFARMSLAKRQLPVRAQLWPGSQPQHLEPNP